MTHLGNDDSTEERFGLQIPNLDIPILTSSIDDVVPDNNREYGALFALECVLQLWSAGS